MIVGHTRCTVDGFFGLFKQTYRRSDADTMAHLVEVVERSASANSAQYYNDADKPVRFFSWDTFLGQIFTPTKGISKFHHFEMDIEQPGLLKAKASLSGETQTVSLLKKNVTTDMVVAAGLPPVVPPGGISEERKRYLFKHVREFFRPEFQDLMRPNPNL